FVLLEIDHRGRRFTRALDIAELFSDACERDVGRLVARTDRTRLLELVDRVGEALVAFGKCAKEQMREVARRGIGASIGERRLEILTRPSITLPKMHPAQMQPRRREMLIAGHGTSIRLRGRF